MENKIKIFTVSSHERKLEENLTCNDGRFDADRKVKYRPCGTYPEYDVSCTQIHKELLDERVATIFESTRNKKFRHIAVIARGDTELSKSVAIAHYMGLIPESAYSEFLSE